MDLQYLFFFYLSQLNLTKTKFVSADAEAGHSCPFPRHQAASSILRAWTRLFEAVANK